MMKQLKGKEHWNWKGGFYINASGYKLLNFPDHPRADSKGYVYEHLLVAEQKLGRSLLKGEEVHHVNHNRSDNRPDNLMVFQNHKDHLQYEKTSRRIDWEANGKVCHVCGLKKSASDFVKSWTRCKSCENKRHASWRHKNAQHVLDYWSLWRASH